MEKKKIPSKIRVFIALVLGGIFLIGGFVVPFNNPHGNTIEEIQQVEEEIDTIPKHRLTLDEMATIPKSELMLEEIDKITSSLVYTNQRIAKAKALLLYFKENPKPSDSYDSYLWENRFDISKQDWTIQNFSSRILTSTGIGFGIFFASSIVTYLILTIVPWLWYFLLNRISELSQAIRGG